MSSQTPKDPLAIGIAVVGLLAQIGLWFYWGGKLESRVESVEKDVQRVETQQAEAGARNATQDVQIGVNVSQYTEVIRRLDSIERKVEGR